MKPKLASACVFSHLREEDGWSGSFYGGQCLANLVGEMDFPCVQLRGGRLSLMTDSFRRCNLSRSGSVCWPPADFIQLNGPQCSVGFMGFDWTLGSRKFCFWTTTNLCVSEVLDTTLVSPPPMPFPAVKLVHLFLGSNSTHTVGRSTRLAPGGESGSPEGKHVLNGKFPSWICKCLHGILAGASVWGTFSHVRRPVINTITNVRLTSRNTSQTYVGLKQTYQETQMFRKISTRLWL